MSRRYETTARCPACGYEARATKGGVIGGHACRHRQAVTIFGIVVTCNVGHALKDVHWKDVSNGGSERWMLRCCDLSVTLTTDRAKKVLAPIRAAGYDRVPLRLISDANGIVP